MPGFKAKYESLCPVCGEWIHVNMLATKPQGSKTVHLHCGSKAKMTVAYSKMGIETALAANLLSDKAKDSIQALIDKPVSVAKPVSEPSPFTAQSQKAAIAALKAKIASVGGKSMADVVIAELSASKPNQPQTQKAKGILMLQAAGLLPKQYAIIATTLEQAQAAWKILEPAGERFVRPCPITPRHGFVESRIAASLDVVEKVWLEAKAADPLAELIIMPKVKASHNMIWKPGLLAIGPNHDGATAGIDSVGVPLCGQYSAAWMKLAKTAGVSIDDPDPKKIRAPFVEAVANDQTGMVLTQIRAGANVIPTEPDWNPYDGMTVGEVVSIPPEWKADPDQMLKWETTAKSLTPKYHVVYNPSGNQGDHYTVHAQDAGISVITTFQPAVGQKLGKLGVDLKPLDPNAIIYGFLGGLLGPSLKGGSHNLMQCRAVCAAMLGAHHGQMMSGESGVFLGASVAYLLRLAQAALWGEARHNASDENHKKGLSRQQVFHLILDDWMTGRSKLLQKVELFHQWGTGGVGGDAWAAIGRGTIALDSSMMELIRMPSEVNAGKVKIALVNLINLSHNNSWFMDKFTSSQWFNLAAELDPRVAIVAGPIWYMSVLVSADDRMKLFDRIQKLEPLIIKPQHAAKKLSIKYANHGTMPDPSKATMHPTPQMPDQLAGLGSLKHKIVQPQKDLTMSGGKLGSFGVVEVGVSIDYPIVKAQGKIAGDTLHAQVQINEMGGYVSGEVTGLTVEQAEAIAGYAEVPSLSGSGVTYKQLPVATITEAIPSSKVVVVNTFVLKGKAS